MKKKDTKMNKYLVVLNSYTSAYNVCVFHAKPVEEAKNLTREFFKISEEDQIKKHGVDYMSVFDLDSIKDKYVYSINDYTTVVQDINKR